MSKRTRRRRLATVAAVAAVSCVPLTMSTSAFSVTPDTGTPGVVASSSTPLISDGEVDAITQVGNTVIVGGTFQHTVSNWSANAVVSSHPYILAFDATTGAINTAFAPALDGTVLSLLPGPTAGTVYVAGSFKTLNGAKSKSLALLNVADGRPVTGFKTPPMNGIVQDMKLVNGHLYIGGTFTTLSSQPHGGWGLLNPLTGASDKNFAVTVTGHHNYDTGWATKPGATGVQSFDITPDGTTAVVIGNFTKVNGLPHDQIAMFSLSGDTATLNDNWTSSVFTAQCGHAFDSWVRQVRFSPDGRWFVVASTGAYSSPTTICDSAARFETPTSVDVLPVDHQPSWIANTGQDSLWSVAVTSSAVYLGGHERWLNDANGHNTAAPGAVARPGIAAVDPTNGLPLAWNPGRHPRGIGAKALFVSPNGLYVGSDQEYFGLPGDPTTRVRTGRLGFFSIDGTGAHDIAAPVTPTLPGTVYLVSNGQLVARSYDGSTAGADVPVPGAASLPLTGMHGAFLLNGTLYYSAGGTFNALSFDGTSVGTPIVVNPYSTAWDGITTGDAKDPTVTYKGAPPTFYNKLNSITGMAYANGRIFYTVSGSKLLFYRWFTPDSGVIGAVEYSLPPTIFGVSGGLMIGNGQLYVTNRNTGAISAVAFSPGGTGVTPTVGTALTSLGGSKIWATNALFVSGS